MKKIFFILFSFIIAQNSFSSETKTYIRGDYGIGKFKSDKLDALNANPSGPTFGVGFGARMSHVELGLFFKNFSLSEDIVNDGVANKIQHDGKSFGVDMNVFLNSHLSLKLGYAFNTFDQKFETPVNAATLAAMKTNYGIESGYNSSNIFYGASLNLFAGKTFDTVISVVHMPMGKSYSSTSAQIGFTYYMDSSFADFFGL